MMFVSDEINTFCLNMLCDFDKVTFDQFYAIYGEFHIWIAHGDSLIEIRNMKGAKLNIFEKRLIGKTIRKVSLLKLTGGC